MGEFEIQYSQAAPSGRPNAAPIVADVMAPGRAIAGLGEELFRIGDKFRLQQDAMEMSVLERQYDEMFNQYSAELGTITDPDLAAKKVAEFTQKADSLASGKRSGVQAAYQAHVNQTIGNRQYAFGQISEKTLQRDALDKHRYARQSAIEAGDDAAVRKYDALALKTGMIGEEEYKALSASVPVDIIMANAARAVDANPMEAIKTLTELKENSSMIIGRDLSIDEIAKANKIMSIARKQTGALSEEANKNLTDLMASGKLTLDSVRAYRQNISDVDYQAWTKIAMNPADKRGNVIQSATLKSMSADIWRGALSRTEFDAKVRESLADPDGINDQQYADVVGVADTQLKATQAEDIRRFSRDAANVILGQYAGAIQFDAMGNMNVNMAGLMGDDIENVKYRMHYLSLYEQGLRDFIADNPTVSGKDLYLFAKEQKMRYWNTSIDEMKRIAKSAPVDTPTVRNKAEFDALPSGTEFMAPDGTRRRKQ